MSDIKIISSVHKIYPQYINNLLSQPGQPASQDRRPPSHPGSAPTSLSIWARISKNTWKVTKKTNKTVHAGDKTSKNHGRWPQKTPKPKFGRLWPLGTERAIPLHPPAKVSQILFFFVFLVTFHGFLLVLSPSCMVLSFFLVTFHVFFLIQAQMIKQSFSRDKCCRGAWFHSGWLLAGCTGLTREREGSGFRLRAT